MRSARAEIINGMKWKWNQCRDTSLVQWKCMAWRPVWLMERKGWRRSPWNLLTIPPSCFWKYFYSESENPLKQRDGSAVWVKISLLKPTNSFKSWWGRCLSSLIQWPEGNEPGVSLWEEPTRERSLESAACWQLWPMGWRLNCLSGKSWLVSHLKEGLDLPTEWDRIQCGCISESQIPRSFSLASSNPFSSLQLSDILKTEIGLCLYLTKV